MGGQTIKWFKHISDALDDPFICALMDKYGHAGYVAWFGLIEIIAKESGTDLTGELDISPIYLKRKLRISRAKLQQIFNFCDTFGKLSFNNSKDLWHFDFPKMLELKDNYTKDLQVTSKKLSLEAEAEQDTEEDKESNKAHIEQLQTLLDQMLDKLGMVYFNPYQFIKSREISQWPIECHIDILQRLLDSESFMAQEVEKPHGYALSIFRVEAQNIVADMSEAEAEQYREEMS